MDFATAVSHFAGFAKLAQEGSVSAVETDALCLQELSAVL